MNTWMQLAYLTRPTLPVLFAGIIFCSPETASATNYLTQKELDAKLSRLSIPPMQTSQRSVATQHRRDFGTGFSYHFQCTECGVYSSRSWEKRRGRVNLWLARIRAAGVDAALIPNICSNCRYQDWKMENQALFAPNAITVSEEGVILRCTTNFEFNRKLPQGAALTVLDLSSTDYRIKPPDDLRIFVRADLLSNTGELLKESNLRTEPDVRSPSIGIWPRGTMLKICPEQSAQGWYQVTIPTTCTFYIPFNNRYQLRIPGKLSLGECLDKSDWHGMQWIIKIDGKVRKVDFDPFDVFELANFLTCSTDGCPDCIQARDRLADLVGSTGL